jgi:hypothetical protein
VGEQTKWYVQCRIKLQQIRTATRDLYVEVLGSNGRNNEAEQKVTFFHSSPSKLFHENPPDDLNDVVAASPHSLLNKSLPHKG